MNETDVCFLARWAVEMSAPPTDRSSPRRHGWGGGVRCEAPPPSIWERSGFRRCSRMSTEISTYLLKAHKRGNPLIWHLDQTLITCSTFCSRPLGNLTSGRVSFCFIYTKYEVGRRKRLRGRSAKHLLHPNKLTFNLHHMLLTSVDHALNIAVILINIKMLFLKCCFAKL